MMLRKGLLIGLSLLGLLGMALSLPIASAQNDIFAALETLSLDERVILETLNERRTATFAVALVPNNTLNQIAEAHLNDLLSRTRQVDIYLSTDANPEGAGLNIEGMAAAYGYASYSDSYEVDLVPIIIENVAPRQIIEYWVITDQRSQNPEIFSQQSRRDPSRGNPIFLQRYREVGIAFQRADDASGVFYYVLVMGSQPNVIPVFVIDPQSPLLIAERVTSRDVVLAVHDERARLLSPGGEMAQVQFLRVSEQPTELDCPTDRTEVWEDYSPEVPFRLSQGSGVKTIYVQMCDIYGTSLVMQTQVIYQDPNDPTPTSSETTVPIPLDVLGIVYATQTVAAASTMNAPLMPTVEYILTATQQARAR